MNRRNGVIYEARFSFLSSPKGYSISPFQDIAYIMSTILAYSIYNIFAIRAMPIIP